MLSNPIPAAPNGISVLVAGAGIGGMSAALECWRRGCKVRVIERGLANAPQGQSTLTFSHLNNVADLIVGDAVQILVTGIRLFDNWPYLKQKNREILYPTLASFHDITGTRYSGPLDPETLMNSNKDGNAPKERRTFRHSRPKFAAMLEKQLNLIGIEIEYNKEVVDYFENETNAGVIIKDGSRYEADLVIAADGARGRSLPLVAGCEIPARSSGSAMFRVAFPVEYALADPLVAARFPLNKDGSSTAELWVG